MRLKKIIRKAVQKRSIYEPLEYGLKRSTGIATASQRLLPDFIIIGGQKCGTTSLFYYLSQHPEIYPAYPKEINFFSLLFNKGINWYRSHFPLGIQKKVIERSNTRRMVTGEASPSYFTYPHAPSRILNVLPDVLLIVLLRNPVERAYSHYNMSKRNGTEQLSFSDALDQEDERIHPEIDKMMEDQHYRSSDYLNFSYMNRGLYLDHLSRWSVFFERHRMLVINSGEFYSNPRNTLHQVEDFLGISPWELNDYKKYAPGTYSPMDSITRKRLQEFFEPYNQKLYDYLEIDLGWEGA